ncbi:hypothetical protein VMCG_00959 [Cytospora schulzeri]|uniref:Uncharacterized protein n=1 Tax=Cytospora schulzeri TaxID=448051 RepID=A0A423X5E2_9PEZI|nr:hypothetical protein VMCG_00959 [Valsa malicola]
MLDRFKAFTEHCAVKEAARLGALEVRIMQVTRSLRPSLSIACQLEVMDGSTRSSLISQQLSPRQKHPESIIPQSINHGRLSLRFMDADLENFPIKLPSVLFTMAAMHDFTEGTGVGIRKPDHYHATYHIKSTEWGQKKVHVYLRDWKAMTEPISSIVFIQNHGSLGVENAGIDPTAYQAIWHSNLSFGLRPAWLVAKGKTLDNLEGKPALDLEAKVTFKYINDRATEFQAAVEDTDTLPLKPCIAKLGVHMYTKFSPIVAEDSGAGKAPSRKGQFHQMDYKERR